MGVPLELGSPGWYPRLLTTKAKLPGALPATTTTVQLKVCSFFPGHPSAANNIGSPVGPLRNVPLQSDRPRCCTNVGGHGCSGRLPYAKAKTAMVSYWGGVLWDHAFGSRHQATKQE